MDAEKVSDMVDKMDREADSIRNESLKLVWYMRGGVTYSEVMNLGSREREMMGAFIKENLETTKKTGLSFF